MNLNNFDLKNFLNTKFSIKNNVYFSCKDLVESDQKIEIEFRKKEANIRVDDYLETISKNHSIQVMDYEIEKFLKKVKENGLILDVGGCWGWHWRKINIKRPDVKILIVDLLRSNLIHAQKLLNKLIGQQVFLLEGNATSLKLPDQAFDAVWTVQTLQHIPNFKKAVEECYRVLKKNGYFINYSLNQQLIIKILYKFLRKNYVVNGYIDNKFWLSRASNKQMSFITDIFKNKVDVSYSELIFSPEIKLTNPGKPDSVLGKIDKYLSGNNLISKIFATQKSFSCKK